MDFSSPPGGWQPFENVFLASGNEKTADSATEGNHRTFEECFSFTKCRKTTTLHTKLYWKHHSNRSDGQENMFFGLQISIIPHTTWSTVLSSINDLQKRIHICRSLSRDHVNQELLSNFGRAEGGRKVGRGNHFACII